MKTRKHKPMGVYWINLERSTERREKMLTLLKDPVFDGMTKHRVNAIDGKHITKKDLHVHFENIPKKRIRSLSGTVSSAASCNTLLLKDNQLISLTITF